MGSFYTQVVVATGDASACADSMKRERRSAIVIPADNGISIVCDRQCEEQDLAVLDSVALKLSADLNAGAVALLNHDDDVLVLRYFDRGQRAGGLEIGMTPLSLRGAVRPLRRLLRPSASVVDLYAVFLRPRVFQVLRHRHLAEVLDLPRRSVGYGYRYIVDPKLRDGFDMAGIIQV